jgi:hypothetical protein
VGGKVCPLDTGLNQSSIHQSVSCRAASGISYTKEEKAPRAKKNHLFFSLYFKSYYLSDGFELIGEDDVEETEVESLETGSGEKETDERSMFEPRFCFGSQRSDWVNISSSLIVGRLLCK